MFGTDLTYQEYATHNREREKALRYDATLPMISEYGKEALLNVAGGAADNAIRAEMAIARGEVA